MNHEDPPPALPFAEACERNKAPILEALRPRLPERGHLLEIGSGTGQHAVFFAPFFPGLSWQPTERGDSLEGLNARIRQEGGQNVLPAIELNVESVWPNREYAAAFSSNTAHIMPWRAVGAMFASLGERLVPGAPFCLYGPFNRDGGYTADSNTEFDLQLRARDPDMGLRDMEALEALGAGHGLILEEVVPMPANNYLLLFRMAGR